MTFAELPIGARFRWMHPPYYAGMILYGLYVKGSATTFGDVRDGLALQSFEVTVEMNSPVIEIPPSDGSDESRTPK